MPALGVELALEAVERDLAHHRVDHVLDLGGEHGLALLVLGIGEQLLKVSISPNTLAVSASVSGVGAISAPFGAASTWCTPWPSSCASVITSRGLP